MKTKFIKVWDDQKFGYVKFIILQVEETDKFLTDANFNPGYKFIVQALYNNVGAAGGYNFNAYHGNRTRNLSKKINTTEADVLGFYLQNVPDIHKAPDELHTEKIWDVVRTNNFSKEDLNNNDENCYKVLITSIYENSQELFDNTLKALNNLEGNDYFDNLDLEALRKKLKDDYKWLENIGVNHREPTRHVKLALIHKDTLKEVSCRSSSTESIIADYLWLPNDELPYNLWPEIVNLNEGYSLMCIYNHIKEGYQK
ncbi:hypothetical protein [Cytobacillus praedii]|uniref:hypothetical protein n=1 Tax=Cytobacillus praedii TaxID=1742358 RepID=UPI002E2190F5|nr:hypothetical protein [Cytobacillus praedii]